MREQKLDCMNIHHSLEAFVLGWCRHGWLVKDGNGQEFGMVENSCAARNQVELDGRQLEAGDKQAPRAPRTDPGIGAS